MIRRTFLQTLGVAVLGTIIALKLPETIAPLNKALEKAKISFTALDTAYRKCCIDNIEPNLIIVSPNTYADIYNLLGPYPYADEHGIIFYNARIKPDNIGVHEHLVKAFGFGALEDNQINVSGDFYGTLGNFYFTWIEEDS